MGRFEDGRVPAAQGVAVASAPGRGLRRAARREGGQDRSGDRPPGCAAPVANRVASGRPIPPSRPLALSPSAVRRLAALAVLAMVGASTGCTALDNALAKVPFLSFMQASPAFSPYEMTRPAPPGSIPYESPAGEVFPGLQPTETSLRDFGAAHANPVPPADSAALKAGQALFLRYCYVCHGPEAKGDGPILNQPTSSDTTQRLGKFPFAPNLTLPTTVERADGYIFGIITVGRGLMPEYGSKIPAPERWYVVNYLRTLQHAANAGAGAAAPAAGGAPATGAPAGGAGAAAASTGPAPVPAPQPSPTR